MKNKSFSRFAAVLAVILCLVSLTAFAAEVKPGLNIFTGTTAKYTFDGAESDISGFNTSGVTVQTYPNDNTGNKALAYTKQHQYIAVKDFAVTEAARPYKVYIDVDYTGQVRFMASEPYDSGLLNCADAIVIYGQPAGKWTSLNYTIKGTQNASAGTGDFFDADHTGKPFPNLYVYMFTVLKATDAPTYIDNLSIIPYYGVHFDLNGGVGSTESEYHLSAAGTTYTIMNTGSNIMKPGYTFVGWSDKKDGTKADIITSYTVELGKDIQLYAVWEENADDTRKSVELYDGETLRTFYVVEEGKERVLPELETTADGKIMQGWKTADGNSVYGYKIPVVRESLKLYSSYQSFESAPGINMFENGDFEKDGIIDVRPSNGRFTIVSDTDGNRMLEYERGSGYASIQLPVEWEHGRKYKVSYRFKADYAAGTAINMKYDGADHIISASQQGVNANEWYSYETDYIYNNDDHVKKNNDALNIYYNPNSAGKGGTVYYDDLVFIPYYKITYHANGGTGAPADDFTLAEKYTVSTDTLARPGYIFKGWSLKNGSITAVTEVETVPGKDIDLYAIWEKAGAEDAIFYDLVSDVPGVANGSINIVCPEEAADYTSVAVYLANNDGIMEGYTPFATMQIEGGMAAYAVNGNRSFAEGATRLAFVFKADGMDDITYWYTIPEAHRFDAKNHELKYSFWATSDTHLGGYNEAKDTFTDYWNEMSRNREYALKDIFASDADFMFINGDVVNYGPESYANTLKKFIEMRLTNPAWNKNNIPVFLINGNHEYMNSNNANGGYSFDPIQSTFTEYLALVEKNYPDVKVTRDEDKMWYAVDYLGAKFIYLSTPEETEAGDAHTYYASARQLKFLEEQLFDGEKSNKTSFVITHVPLAETYKYYKGWEDGISNTDAVKEILARHPNTVVCSGHTHSEIAYESEHFVGVGDMTTTFSHFNDGGMVWISAFDGVSGDDGHIKDYSTGMLVEVYNDVIVIKGREFRENSRFYGHVNYIIPTQDSNAQVAKAEISGVPTIGATLTADIENPDNYTYEWFVNGVKVSTENTWTIDNNPAYGGEYVYLRAIDENGYYVTTKSAVPFSGATVKYDLNGGSGECPETRKVLEGEYLIDNSKFPTKSGHFFIGWSTDKNALKPMTSLNITEDVTLYAVYTDKPKFYFDANNSGFKPNGVASVATVIDGNLVTDVVTAGDQYYTWSNGSFAAADYPYMRIKVKTNGTMDGMFYKSDAGGFAESRHMMFTHISPVTTTADGYEIYEFDILNYPEKEEAENWYGTISALRYDAMWSTGTTYTDYIVFTDKKGIYKADLTLDSTTNTVLPSADSKNFTISSVKNGLSFVTITLTPDKGYEFTTVEDLMTIVTVNGEAVSDAVIDENGNAVITFATELVIVIGTPDADTEPVYLSFDETVVSSTVIVAAYDSDNRFVAADIDKYDAVKDIKVYVEKALGIKTIKVFALDGNGKLNPLTKEIEQKIKGERIVKMTEVVMNQYKEYYVVYDLFNPYTVATIENVPGTYKTTESENISAKWSAGDVVFLKDGLVPDEADDKKLGSIIGGNDDLWWVLDCNTEENYIEVINVPSVSSNDELASAVENSTVYKIGVSDAGATIIGHQSSKIGIDMVRWGSLKVADIAKLDGSDKSYLAANKTWTNPETGNLKTVYSSYVKIYLDADWASKSDLTAVNSDGLNAEANFIMVVANTGEDTNLCVLK